MGWLANTFLEASSGASNYKSERLCLQLLYERVVQKVRKRKKDTVGQPGLKLAWLKVSVRRLAEANECGAAASIG